MNNKVSFKAINIVFKHWIIPSQSIRLNALKKIQRFCRRGSGVHAHNNMICNNISFSQLWEFEPPVLYRQICSCIGGECKSIPIRIYNKYQRMHYAIQKIYGGTTGIDASASWSKNTSLAMNKYFTSNNQCFCNNKPFGTYEMMVTNPRGNFTSNDGLKYIMCELSGDELTYYTRFKLSNYLTHRLN
jgi:hypothetical protein